MPLQPHLTSWQSVPLGRSHLYPLPSSMTAPKDVWVSGNLCGTPGRQEPLLLWKVSYGEQFHSFCTCREAPDNTSVNKTAGSSAAFLGLLRGGDAQRGPSVVLGTEQASTMSATSRTSELGHEGGCNCSKQGETAGAKV